MSTDSRTKAAAALAEAEHAASQAGGPFMPHGGTPLVDDWEEDCGCGLRALGTINHFSPAGLHALAVYALEQHPEWLVGALRTIDLANPEWDLDNPDAEAARREHAAAILAALRDLEVPE